jgi:hypothetical protein
VLIAPVLRFPTTHPLQNLELMLIAPVAGERLLFPTTHPLQNLELMLIAPVAGELLLFPATHYKIWS